MQCSDVSKVSSARFMRPVAAQQGFQFRPWAAIYRFSYLVFIACCLLSQPSFAEPGLEANNHSLSAHSWTLQARAIAVNLPKAYGLRQVGRFHSGGPIASNPEFSVQTQPGRILDPRRLLVATESNFGERLADGSVAPGAVLSIDPEHSASFYPLNIAGDLALHLRSGRSAGAPVQIYSLQSESYLNRRHNPRARTAGLTAVSGPRYISINNAFGRPWIANSPYGLSGLGSESVVDPDGAPLANAPSKSAGGVFAGSITARDQMTKAVRSGFLASMFNYRRSPQLTAGTLNKGALGTAFLGPSPDGSGFAVFAIVTGEGAVTQAHVQDGVDGLAPPGTIAVGPSDPGLVGIAFKWAPQRVLYVADPQRNRIALLHLTDDTRHFKLKRVSHIASRWLSAPVDIAAAIPEVANPHFASHTTLAGDADFYVVNRGDGSLLRLSQQGKLVARAVVANPDGSAVGPQRLRSIAVSADAQKLWLIVDMPNGSEAARSTLIEVPAFDANGPFAPTFSAAAPQPKGLPLAYRGRAIFTKAFTRHEGLGPQFNANSCVACHPGPGGASPSEEHFVRRLGRVDSVTGRPLSIHEKSSQIAHRFQVTDTATERSESLPPPRDANLISMRMPLSLFAVGKIDDIPDAVIEAQAISKGDGIKGRVHYVKDDGVRRVGRYGWKADVVKLNSMVAQAFTNELGITSAKGMTAPSPVVEDDGTMVQAVTEFLRNLRRPSAAR